MNDILCRGFVISCEEICHLIPQTGIFSEALNSPIKTAALAKISQQQHSNNWFEEMCYSIYKMLFQLTLRKQILNGEVFSVKKNYFNRMLIMKNHGSLEPCSLNILISRFRNTLFSKLTLLCQSRYHMHSWNIDIYL